MSATLEELDVWLSEPEAERLEFKEAKSNCHFETLARSASRANGEGRNGIRWQAEVLDMTGDPCP